MRLVALLALLNVAACHHQGPNPIATHSVPGLNTMSFDGMDRTYVLDVPRNHSNAVPAPLLILLHGKSSNANQILSYSRLGKLAPEEGFIVLAPNGTGKVTGWNCGFMNMGERGVDDLKFIGALLAKMESEYSIDSKRIFVAGHSNGGIMSYAVASAFSDKVAAIGVVEGSAGLDRPRIKKSVEAPANPVSAIIFHGRLDPLIPYTHRGGLADMFLPPVESATLWAHDVGGVGEPKTSQLPQGGSVMDWMAQKAEVKLITVDEGKHMWPGGVTTLRSESSPIDATMIMLEFFRSHPKP